MTGLRNFLTFPVNLTVLKNNVNSTGYANVHWLAIIVVRNPMLNIAILGFTATALFIGASEFRLLAFIKAH